MCSPADSDLVAEGRLLKMVFKMQIDRLCEYVSYRSSTKLKAEDLFVELANLQRKSKQELLPMKTLQTAGSQSQAP